MMNARLLFPTSGGAKPGRLFAALAVGLLLPASTAPAATPGERGKPFLATFTPDEYDAQTQNWSVAQDQRGIVYAANLDGVLEYDGVRWRLIGTPGKISAWSLARGADGTLWVGASGDLGFLRPDSRGSGRFVSLLEHVPEGLRGFGAVRQIVPTPEGVFFLEARHLFRWRGGGEGDEPTAMKSWDLGEKDPSTFSHLSYVQDRLLVARQGVGLLELHGESFEPLAGSELFAEHSVEAVGSLEDGTLVVGTFTEGLFLYDGTSARRWETAAGAYARDKLTTGVTRLADGRFALTTYRGGVALFDRSGAVVRVVDKASGLPDNTVRGPAYEDAQGGLWLPLNHGLARVEVGSALEYYDDDLGLDGLILSILRQRGTLYAGTTQGLFALEPAASGAGMARFVRVAGIEGGCGDLLAFRDRLLAATSRGVFEVKTEPPVVEALFPEASYRLAASRDGVRVYVGTRSSGLHALSYRDGRFVHEGRVGRSSDYIRHIVEDASGRLWLKAFTPQRTERIERVDPATSEVGSWRVTVYGPERGLSPREDLVPFRWRDQLFVGAPNRIYRLAADRFEPAPELEAVLPARVDLGAPTVDGRGRLWFYVSPYRAARAEVDRFGKVRLSFPLDRARVREYLAFHTEETDERSSVVWAGGVDGRLIRYDDESSERTGAESFSAMIRRVSVAQAGGALLFGGTAPQARNPLVLPYAANSLRFEYALPRFDAGEANTYQSRLVGHDETWSEWSEEAYRDFTALWEGRYRFEVRGRDVYGRNSEIASFGFRVLPPWYRAWWAMTLYGLAFLASMGVYVRGHRKKLEEKTAQVRERQRLVEELEAKNAELETFTYTVSHDLKSPLFTIQGFLGMLRKDAVSGNTEQLEHDIGRIRTAADQMALLLEDLLELSRVGRRVNPPEAVAFDELAREAVELVAGRIAKRDVKFSIEPELPVVFGDRVRLLQVLQNLIENAVRFMGDERAPRIDVGARQNGEEVIFFVQDNGIGIEPRYHEKIFGLFERLNPDAESTGVGLALVKRIVELHGGRVWVDSEGPGRGSRFCFTLPRGGGAGGGDG